MQIPQVGLGTRSPSGPPRTPWKIPQIRWVNPHRGGPCFLPCFLWARRPAWRTSSPRGSRRQGELAINYFNIRQADVVLGLQRETIAGYESTLRIARNVRVR